MGNWTKKAVRQSSRGKTPTVEQVANHLRAVRDSRAGDTELPPDVVCDSLAKSFPAWRANFTNAAKWRVACLGHVKRSMRGVFTATEKRDALAAALRVMQSVKPGDTNPQTGGQWCAVSIADKIQRLQLSLELANSLNDKYADVDAIELQQAGRAVSETTYIKHVGDDAMALVLAARRMEQEIERAGKVAEKNGVEPPVAAQKQPKSAKK